MIYFTRCLASESGTEGGMFMSDFSFLESVLAGVVTCLLWHYIQKWLEH